MVVSHAVNDTKNITGAVNCYKMAFSIQKETEVNN